MAEVWTIQRCLSWTQTYLAEKGETKPRFLAEWLLSSVTKKSRIELYLSFDQPLSAEELKLMHTYVVRLVKGEPIQYITGETQFRTLTIACRPGVLIPRPETELLVEEVLNYLDGKILPQTQTNKAVLPWNAEIEAARKAEAAAIEQTQAKDSSAENLGAESMSNHDGTPVCNVDIAHTETTVAADDADKQNTCRMARVLEIGTGTGCISLSLLAERPGLINCVATDIAPAAVELAAHNCAALELSGNQFDLREGDLIEPIRVDEQGQFDVLVSNPPYIPCNVMDKLPTNVKNYEPELALVSGVDGLDMYRRLIDVAPQMLRSGGLFICELYEDACEAAAQLCREAGFVDVRVIADLTQRPRFVAAYMS
ncbi:peptide chain release factor N(5)-glutamine methyltransferase [Collinsella sp. zg1085]|uniref:N5-glutamine methyltransferase family protein n=1 Tax=Collinsella sp. zg1085 TaxID=2844380 RepID=UPI001C0D7E79|nr:HemK/PrmC family methyltransferase [Collinsella sp. zg1085]QWT17776.1 peptide chain release factor N(5)-glutamine methyltransferase [Collinsella sp. zg1085]